MRSGTLTMLLAAGFGLLAPCATASAQTRFSVAGGIASPMSDLGDVADLGFSLAAGLNLGGTNRPIGARLEGNLNQFGLKSSGDDVRIVSASANAIVNLVPGAESPYLIGGVGIYDSRFGRGDSDNAVGVNLGGGLRLAVGTLNGFFEARYHAALSSGSRPHVQFVPVTFGILF